jgi:hypothetical protein
VNIEEYSIKEYTIHVTTAQRSCPLTKIEHINEQEIPKNSSALVENFYS